MSAAAGTPKRATFWREDDPELDAAGIVTRGGMWQHQRDWWHLPNFIRGLVTGYGGGKTMQMGKRMVWLALHNAPVPVITVSPSYPMAQTTIVQTIDELLDGRCTIERGMRYRLFRSQPYRFVVTLPDREATILCMSGEHPDRLKGSNVAAAGIDEPFIQDKAVFDQVVARIRHPMAKRRELNLTGTPEGVQGWGYDLFEGSLRKRYDVGVVQCSSRENRALPRDYVQRLESGFDEASQAAYVDGKFVNLSTNRVYHSFDPTVHVAEIEKPDCAELCVGIDFNVNPMSWVVFWRHGEHLHFVAENERPNSDAEEVAQQVRLDHPTVRNVYPDASGAQRSHAGGSGGKGGGGKSAHQYLQDNGLVINARPSNPLLVDRRLAVNSSFRNGRITISRDCPKLRNYLLAYTHDHAHKQSHKAMSHLLDAFSYPIAYLFPVDRTAMRLVAWR